MWYETDEDYACSIFVVTSTEKRGKQQTNNMVRDEAMGFRKERHESNDFVHQALAGLLISHTTPDTSDLLAVQDLTLSKIKEHILAVIDDY